MEPETAPNLIGSECNSMSDVDVKQHAIDYSQRIPNNVDLANDRTLQRALKQWQPGFLKWWRETGPVETSALQVYLRTAISVDRDGWANFGYVQMPDYRWGIFLTPRDENRKVRYRSRNCSGNESVQG